MNLNFLIFFTQSEMNNVKFSWKQNKFLGVRRYLLSHPSSPRVRLSQVFDLPPPPPRWMTYALHGPNSYVYLPTYNPKDRQIWQLRLQEDFSYSREAIIWILSTFKNKKCKTWLAYIGYLFSAEKCINDLR